MDDPDYTTEIWKTISFAPDYGISDFGRVKRIVDCRLSKAGHILKPWLVAPAMKYLAVGLWINRKKCSRHIHKMVLTEFRGPAPFSGAHCAHSDGCSINNRLGNLRWATVQENHADQDRHGTRVRGARVGTSKLSEAAVRDIRTRRLAIEEFAVMYGVTNACIYDASARKTWRHVS